jgi:hypothetical protein
MELSLDLVVNKTLKKVGTIGTWPVTDNCYTVDIYNTETNSYEFTAHYCPKPVYEMWEQLNRMRKKYRISKTELLPIIRAFNDIGDWKYSEASYDASMNTEDI